MRGQTGLGTDIQLETDHISNNEDAQVFKRREPSRPTDDTIREGSNFLRYVSSEAPGLLPCAEEGSSSPDVDNCIDLITSEDFLGEILSELEQCAELFGEPEPTINKAAAAPPEAGSAPTLTFVPPKIDAAVKPNSPYDWPKNTASGTSIQALNQARMKLAAQRILAAPFNRPVSYDVCSTDTSLGYDAPTVQEQDSRPLFSRRQPACKQMEEQLWNMRQQFEEQDQKSEKQRADEERWLQDEEEKQRSKRKRVEKEKQRSEGERAEKELRLQDEEEKQRSERQQSDKSRNLELAERQREREPAHRQSEPGADRERERSRVKRYYEERQRHRGVAERCDQQQRVTPALRRPSDEDRAGGEREREDSPVVSESNFRIVNRTGQEALPPLLLTELMAACAFFKPGTRYRILRTAEGVCYSTRVTRTGALVVKLRAQPDP